MSNATADQAQAGTATGTPPKAKGSRPTHRLSRVTKSDGTKKYQEIGALWPHKDRKGFNVKLTASANPGEDLMIRLDERGAS